MIACLHLFLYLLYTYGDADFKISLRGRCHLNTPCWKFSMSYPYNSRVSSIYFWKFFFFLKKKSSLFLDMPYCLWMLVNKHFAFQKIRISRKVIIMCLDVFAYYNVFTGCNLPHIFCMMNLVVLDKFCGSVFVIMRINCRFCNYENK